MSACNASRLRAVSLSVSPFSQARSRCRNIDHVSAQAKCSQLERGACSRAWLDEKVDQRFAAQCRHFFDLAGADLLKRVGCLENEIDFFGGQFAQAK